MTVTGGTSRAADDPPAWPEASGTPSGARTTSTPTTTPARTPRLDNADPNMLELLERQDRLLSKPKRIASTAACLARASGSLPSPLPGGFPAQRVQARP